MTILRAILFFIDIVTSVLLIGVILVQKTKDEGLGLAFGAGVGESLFGSRAGNVLTKITVGLAAVFLVNTVIIGLTYTRGGGGGGPAAGSSIVDQLPPDRTMPQQPAPANAEEPTVPAPVVPSVPAPANVTVPVPAPAAPATTPQPAPAPAPSGK